MQILSDDELVSLRKYELVYLATPYSKYEGGIDAAAVAAARVSGKLLKRKVRVFSPIVHTHYVCVATDIDPFDHEFWMDADSPFMDLCAALVVVRMPGWDTSYGVNKEIVHFAESGKPIYGMDP